MELRPAVVGFSDVAERRGYHRRALDVLSSNNPRCLYPPHRSWAHPPEKVLFPAKAGNFASVYESEIHPAILRILGGLMLDFEIHPVRMGFSELDSNDMVLLFIFEHNCISVETAKQTVSAIAEKVNSSWKGERVYVDICQRISEDRRANSAMKVRLQEPYKFVYDDSYPLPGSSIGPRGLQNWTGTLCGYVSHGWGIFALTNHHVVNGPDCAILGSENPYTYVPGQKQHFIVSPSEQDHDGNCQDIKNDRKGALHFEKKEATLWQRQPAITALNASYFKAKTYDRNLGYVYATSGNVPPAANNHRQDWALILCDPRYGSLFENKHRRVGSENPTRIIPSSDRQYARNLYDVEDKWFYEINKEFSASTPYGGVGKPLQPDDPHYLKPPTARSGLRIAVCNGIQSTLQNLACGLTREWTFISPMPGLKVAEYGDSGSSILDKDFNVAALSWGGDKYSDLGDLTFATPFSAVLEDIETRLGWERGSCIWIK